VTAFNAAHLLTVSATVVLFGCAGIGVVQTSDPDAKLSDAYELFRRQDRPIIAERLIREAIDIYRQREDALGLAHSHRQYAELLRSDSVIHMEKFYRERGFQDKSITFENRISKSEEYLRRALEFYVRAEQQFQRAERFDALTNVYYNMAWSNYMLNNNEEACRLFDRSLEAHAENLRRNPDAQVNFPSSFASAADTLAAAKRTVRCK
jgi:tetratricopeptide (TPR) repeat protein